MNSTHVIVIGAGPSGIALAHTLKHKLGFNDFTVSASLAENEKEYLQHKWTGLIVIQFYDKLDGPGGTWRQNTYPGVYV
jgi:cation diffusion facilitator CzcD-associated flavoprotein CzcO